MSHHSARALVRAAIAVALGAVALLAVVASASAHAPAASFTMAPEQPAPDQEVVLTSTSTGVDEHTEPLQLEWDLDGDGAFDDARGTTAERAFPAGSHVVRLRATHAAGHEDVAERTVAVGQEEEPPPPADDPPEEQQPQDPPASPAANGAPVASIDRQCKKSGTFVLCAGLFARESKPHTIDGTPSHDPDGTIVRYEWDLEGDAAFERDTGAQPTVTHTFERYTGFVDTRKRTVRLRVTDDKGATSTTEVTLSLLEPSCEPLATSGRLRVTGLCIRRRATERNGVPVDRWYSERPVTINGITVAPTAGATIVIDRPSGGSTVAPWISANSAVVSFPSKAGDVQVFKGRVAWRLVEGRRLSGFEPSADARLNGLKITGMPSAPELAADATSSVVRLHVALPAQFGGAASDDPIVVTPGKATATASSSEPLRFEVANAMIGPVGLESLVVTYDGIDLWTIATSIALPEPIPYTIKGSAGIRGGKFEHAAGEMSFGTPGVGPFGPVFLQRIAFRVELNPQVSECVPKVGIELVDTRKILHDVTGVWYDVPNFEIDHGIPTFALCGEVGLTAGPTVLGAAAIGLDAGLGLATYDDRPAVFRAHGKIRLVEIPLADADLEVHTNGYTRMGAKFNWGIPDLASLKGHVMFEMRAPKFNALAYVEACIEFVDWCAGAKAIVSSKGVAVCLKIDVVFDDWEPGFGYRWGDEFPDLYFSGCDIGPYREHIESGIEEHIKAVPASVRARKAGFERSIDLPAGLPGATVVARGKGATPRITLVGPKGERITSPDDLRPVVRKPFLVMKDPRAHLTQFAIAKPSAGRWKVVVEEGSADVVSIASAQGLQQPEVSAKVSGRGRERRLTYEIKPIRGQKVTFVERGPSAGKELGTAAGARGVLRFTPAPGKAERRQIVAQVLQDGRLREEVVVARYQAPPAARPGSVRRLRLVRRGAGLRATWKAAPGADLHVVSVRLQDGRRLLYRTRGSSLPVRGLGGRARGSVTVRGMTRGGLEGRGRSVRVERKGR